MDSLSVADFVAFYEEVHGYGPFPWQVALLARVHREGWPALLDVPTGLGKTSLLDVAVFAAALGCSDARRRVFFVVDRRLIVDEAFRHACRIRSALERAEAGSVAGRVAAVLRARSGGEGLEVTRMRGGVTWSWRWVERPDQYAIVVGTVDQIGSRLLFRGYGLSDSLRPIDAALVGTDSLIVVDEAHLSQPFLTTLGDALSMDTTPADAQPRVVSMTASPNSDSTRVHTITTDDEANRFARQRLHARKHGYLVEVSGTTKKNNHQQTAAALAQWAGHLAREHRVVGVVCNTVARARAVFEILRGQHPDQCLLLTGRIRPVDRDYLLLKWYDRIKAGCDTDPEEPIFAVATQTVEVGANLDFSALVTESASLPALVQRLGRLNRLGRMESAAPAVIVHSPHDPDGVYGEARANTWAWLPGPEVSPWQNLSPAG
ncbi:type I-G CRISPR-associated helicase/endonuclease Cas3g [Sinosporangium siamense]|uniref:Type I-U CRISPR-associated helicase/endonuclease Cas3 n=1 Tax=Sinosporangium siamense TaxID=1367973 RepID=A0A919RM61_9ACTN|nr:type I-U CRISPR-associated helicase/endonuclease Cas3 [Sinosporangium siamense]GII96340.1 hypothetical protein Ssi02_65710 [Sinosporangium siamense]